MAAARNDVWRWDELVLALDLYWQTEGADAREFDRECDALSRVLDQLGSLTAAAKADTYRNKNGVRLKLMNFRRFDPKHQQLGHVGMRRGGKTEAEVWERYAKNRIALREEALRILAGIELARGFEAVSDNDNTYEAEEGGVQMRAHRYFERDRKLIAKKKAAAMRAGRPICEACDFDFEQIYGSFAAGFIEVHHTKPVHLMKPGQKTRLSDLALLCSNCHRIAHRRCPPLNVAELRRLIEATRAAS